MINLSELAPILKTPKPIFCTQTVLDQIERGEKDTMTAVCRIAWMFLFDRAGIIDEKNNLFRITLGGKYYVYKYTELDNKYLISDEEE